VIGFRNPLPGSFQDLRTIEDLFREDIQTKPFTVKLKANYYEEDEKILKQDLLRNFNRFSKKVKVQENISFLFSQVTQMEKNILYILIKKLKRNISHIKRSLMFG